MRVWELLNALPKQGQEDATLGSLQLVPGHTLFTLALELSKILLSESRKDPNFNALCGEAVTACASNLEEISQRGEKSPKLRDAGHFQWRDGILVEAMIEGYWLHLEGVNLCPSSVLDRLNSVMEKDGHLLLSECGTQSGDGDSTGHRIIKPHPNFRVFLSMNPIHGEVSRAMRNRCVEIFLLQPIGEGEPVSGPSSKLLSSMTTAAAAVDSLGILWRGGIRSAETAAALVKAYIAEHKNSNAQGGETPCIQGMHGSSRMLSTLLSLGISGKIALQKLLQLALEIDELKAVKFLAGDVFSVHRSGAFSALPPCPDLRFEWSQNPTLARVGWDARLLRDFTDAGETKRMILLASAELFLFEDNYGDSALTMNFSSFGEGFLGLRNALLQTFLSKIHTTDLASRCSFFYGLDSPCARAFSAMVTIMRKHLQILDTSYDHEGMRTSSMTPSPNSGELLIRNPVLSLRLDRLSQQLTEKEFYHQTMTKSLPSSLSTDFSVLEASVCIHEGRMDRASISCTLTPAIYPLILAVDELAHQLLADFSHDDFFQDCHLFYVFRGFIGNRDGLWRSTRNTSFLSHPGAFLGFDESEFVVQWKWLKKSLLRLWSTHVQFASTLATMKKRRVDVMVENVDTAIFGTYGCPDASNGVRKRMSIPLVPHRANHWEAIAELRRLANDFTIVMDARFHPFGSSNNTLELGELVDLHHPILFLQRAEKLELLTAISMVHWASTDELQGVKRSECLASGIFDAASSLRRSLDQKRDAFGSKLSAIKVDSNIETIENLLGVEKLEELRFSPAANSSHTESYSKFIKSLLESFGRIQLSALAEFWSCHEEARLVREICQIVVASGDPCRISADITALLPSLKYFIDVVISKTFWTVTDLRPFQTLVWAIDSAFVNGGSFQKLLRCLLPTMSATASKHMWSNSFVDLNALTTRIDLPTFWSEDSDSWISSSTASHQPPAESQKFGPARLKQRVRSDISFRIFGSQFMGSTLQRRAKLYTIENHEARRMQSQQLLNMLASLTIKNPKKTAPYEISYLLGDVLQALSSSFPDNTSAKLVELAQQPELLLDVSQEQIFALGKQCSHRVFLACLDRLVMPLFDCVRCIWKNGPDANDFEEQLALAWIYVGLLRINFLAPDSPLDPGRAPLAKVSLVDRKLTEIRLNVFARRLDSGFTGGNFSPDSVDTHRFLDEGKKLVEKKISQEKRVVERPDSSPPFFDLFRETKDFVEGPIRTDSVLNLVGVIRGARNETGKAKVAIQRERNWQRTVAAFCCRLQSYFASYEDITTPFVDAVQWVQRGMCILVDECTFHAEDSCAAKAFDVLLQFPMGHLREETDAISGALGRVERQQDLNATDRSSCLISLALAALARLSIQKQQFGFDSGSLSSSVSILNGLAKSHLGKLADQPDQAETEEERLEREYREQFPDHHAEFTSLMQTPDESADELDKVPDEESSHVTASNTGLTEQDANLLCMLHRELFSEQSSSVSDPARIRTFCLSYRSAYCLELLLRCSEQNAVGMERMAAHAMALSLASRMEGGNMAVNQDCDNAKQGSFDFHTDPSPSEASTAAKPIEGLTVRLTQLLTAFPGHSILLAIGKVCERVQKFDLLVTPMGKVMAGLEAILKSAQDWEQHASDRVRLGAPLRDIGQLVARWRKLELQSWSRLILGREMRYVKRARRHWMRLHAVLHSDTISTAPLPDEKDRSSFTQQCTPKWVWKGMAQESGRLSKYLCDSNMSELVELMKVLDSFILTSTMGEFKERLVLIESFSKQLLAEFILHDRATNWPLKLSRVLLSLSSHYGQFLPFLSSKLEELRRPIETRLNEEVKLAKWDEQSYYSLADSTERNHRKLMKILAEYDAVLGMNVGLLLQQESCRGIRASVDAHDEMCSSMPPKATMFPFAISPDEQKKLSWAKNKSRVPLESRTWIDATGIGAPVDSHICRMRKYALKMASLQEKDATKYKASMVAATSAVSEFSDAVFERIESLRVKATRPMKERALVDLFRELKRQGFQSTKWSIPGELRSMAHLLLLPPPATDPNVLEEALCSHLEKAEEYFRRSLNELNNFRSEAAMLGSKIITQRQMNMMVHFSEHGLLMLAQQRSSISNLLVDVSAIRLHGSIIKQTETTLPESQTCLFAVVKQFDREIKCVDETLRQLTLLVKSALPLLEKGTALDWALGATSDLESHLSKAAEFIQGNSASIVTWGQLESVWKAQSWLNDASVLIRRLQDENEASTCIPVDAFEKCCDQIVTAQELASKCRDMARANESNTHFLDFTSFSKSLNVAVECTLLAAQGFCGENGLSSETSANVTEDVTVSQGSDNNYSGANMWDSHKDVMRTWARINLKRVNMALGDVLRGLRMLHDENPVSKKLRDCCVGLVTDLHILSEQILQMSKALLRETVLLYRATAKLNYVLLRVFRTLVSKGFCSDVASDGGEGNAEGDTSGMTFEDDQDGTGMGEGEGKRDVTDQLESEEQLLGLKGDQDDSGKAEQPESRQLSEDEAETGMEMEADFDGEMCDLPERPPEKEDDNHDDEEELDRGMGEDGSPDEEVVDEKMWNSDDEEEMDKGEEKFEQDSSMKGEAIEGATRTKDDEESKKKGDDTQEEHDDTDAKPKDDGGDGETAEEDHEINEDQEDRYEESHGVDVRGNEMEDKENAEDDMQLDDDVKLDHEDEGEGEEPVDEAGEDAMEVENEDLPGDTDADPRNEEAAIEDDGTDESPPENSVQPSGIGAGTEDEEAKQDENPEDDKEEEAHVDVLTRDLSRQEAHGVKSSDGKDAIIDDGQEDEDNGGDAKGEEEGEDTGDSNNAQAGGGAGGSGYSERDGMVDESPDNKQNGEMSDAPNPFKNPGDATKFWHRKLNVVDSSTSAEESMGANDELENEKEDKGGDYEFTSPDQKSSAQVLGEVAEDEAVQLESQNEDENSPENQPQDAKNRKDSTKTDDKKNRERGSSRKQQVPDEKQEKEDAQKLDDDSITKDEDADGQDDEESQHSSDEDVEMTDEEAPRRNMVVSDLSRLRVEDQGASRQDYSDIISDEQTTGISSSEVAEARNRWLQIQGETHFLARRLCEKLRLVMEPLVASKLRGDYRSGKRINMKRVIGYIASGYRKDKIWLRRTKPAKRNYRVLVAVDDSESMVRSGAGDMALRAMATLAVGMNQLEIGELGVASFGNDMKILHPFHLPFTSESGANVVRNFQFDQRRTRTALCVASALAALDMPGDQASMQLVFLISDGRIERDSRVELKRLVREMMERNILLAMIIVEGGKGGATKKDSIVNMKEVSFEKGKPIVKRFIEDYPFPYYVVLDDMMALPEVLGDALRQWFEMLTQIQGSS
jgi:midasin (ATPase involved in ribosome maturation)